ncbi:PhnD/SsuA/transferrin family substrate-binding protein [Thiocystis violascens]|uniref:PhnD/SsuA/transferrin family substrate-binding protein n=1 Tax=Thiocystis violascens TaxID=73141 RepID=UPI00022C0A4D|nr:PhnD/SsuA/transferrin family substrate-binding protein [Thiocystis violascens]
MCAAAWTAHDTVAAAVAERKVAAGGLSLPVFRRLVAEGLVDGDAVRLLAESPPIPEYIRFDEARLVG